MDTFVERSYNGPCCKWEMSDKMLNIPFLRKLARVIHVLGWCNIIIAVPASVVSILRQHALLSSASRHEIFRLMPPGPFPWESLATAVLAAVAVGIVLIVVSQLVHLGIGGLEHLRGLDKEEPC